jgi:DNA repair protein RadC
MSARQISFTNLNPTAMNQFNLFNSSFAEIEVTYRNKIDPADMRKVISSNDACVVFREIWSCHIDHLEECYMLMLNKANKVLCYASVSKGGISGTVVDPKIIFQTALKSNASSIIFAHNHPSGNRQPSEADNKITKKIKEAGLLLDIALLDSLILAGDGYYSFADEGTL